MEDEAEGGGVTPFLLPYIRPLYTALFQQCQAKGQRDVSPDRPNEAIHEPVEHSLSGYTQLDSCSLEVLAVCHYVLIKKGLTPATTTSVP